MAKTPLRKYQQPPTTDPRKYAWMLGAAQMGDVATPLTAAEEAALIEVCKSGDLFKVIDALDAILAARAKPKRKVKHVGHRRDRI